MSQELAGELAHLLPGREIRCYEALLSTEAEAMAWARAGAPEGGMVVAGYQASPRGRGGVPWTIRPTGFGLSLVVHPPPPHREGWLYMVGTLALAEVLGEDTTIEWPDQVRLRESLVGGAALQSHEELFRIEWAVLSLMVAESAIPAPEVIAPLVGRVEELNDREPADLLEAYLQRVETIGKMVHARLIPMGPTGVVVSGVATEVRQDGALLVEASTGVTVPVFPEQVGLLEEAGTT